MKKRLPYLIGFLALLGCEILIGAFVRDAFVRPYLGDVLVTALLCCLVRTLWPEGSKALPVWVFAFSAAVEFSQLWDLPRLLSLEGTLWQVLMGSSFDWRDLLCYAAGCGIFALTERKK